MKCLRGGERKWRRGKSMNKKDKRIIVVCVGSGVFDCEFCDCA